MGLSIYNLQKRITYYIISPKKITANLLSDNRKLTVINEKIDGNFR